MTGDELHQSAIECFPLFFFGRALAKRWGAAAGLEAAEAFELIREIR